MTPADLSALEKLLGHPKFRYMGRETQGPGWLVTILDNNRWEYFRAPTWPEAVRRAVEAIEGEEARHED